MLLVFKYDDYYDVGIQMNDTSTLKAHSIKGNASLVSSIYQDNAKVNPDNAEILYCIKY